MQSISRFVALGLGLVLLLASTAGLVEHDHAAAVELASYACAVDHQANGAAGHAESAPDSGLHAAGAEHQHVCPGCHLNGQRLLVAATLGLAGAWSPTPVASRPISRLDGRISWAHPPRRGPPA